MCLIVLAWRPGQALPLVVAANRDEFFARPTAAAAWWPGAPDCFGGRDLEAGGTWFGVTRSGRFAALTNIRDPKRHRLDAPSRGQLVSSALLATTPALATLTALTPQALACNGCNLLVCDGETLASLDNARGVSQVLAAGVFGLSNHHLDTPWPKLLTARNGLEEVLAADDVPDREALFAILADRQRMADDLLPDTGVPLEWERALSSVFVSAPGYGTRSSTVLFMDAQGRFDFEERSFGPNGEETGRVHQRT